METVVLDVGGMEGNTSIRQDSRIIRESVRIHGNDLELFWLLLQQKFLTLDLIQKKFAPLEVSKTPKIYFRLRRLVLNGYLKQFKSNGCILYLLDRQGWQQILEKNRSKIPLVRDEDLKTVAHDLAISMVRFYFEGLGIKKWVSEREFFSHADRISRIPDGACYLNNHYVFIEIEFSQKSLVRYQEIFRIYTKWDGPMKVLYFYKNRSDVDALMRMTVGNPRFGFFPYQESLPPPHLFKGRSANQEVALKEFLYGSPLS